MINDSDHIPSASSTEVFGVWSPKTSPKYGEGVKVLGAAGIRYTGNLYNCLLWNSTVY